MAWDICAPAICEKARDRRQAVTANLRRRRVRSRLGERGVERGLADLDASRDLSNGEALDEERLGAPEFFVRHDGFASALATARRRGVETGAG